MGSAHWSLNERKRVHSTIYLDLLPIQSFGCFSVSNTVGRIELFEPCAETFDEFVLLHKNGIVHVLFVVPHLNVAFDLRDKEGISILT